MKSQHHDIAPLRILPNTRNLERIRSYVGSAITTSVLTSVEQNGVVLAVDEACANLIAHGVTAQPAQEIEVRIDVTGQ